MDENVQMESMEPEQGQVGPAQESTSKWPTILMVLGCGVIQLPAWGFAMTFGIFEDAYAREQVVSGPKSATGIIGTTMNGVMYLSMPFLSTVLESKRWVPWRRIVAIAGTCLATASFLASSWSTEVWHLVLLQGVLAALGNAMLYTPTTLWMNDWFRDRNRATAYGVQFSMKNIVGTGGPFLMYGLLQSLGVRNALRVWAGIALATGLIGITLVPQPREPAQPGLQHGTWSFLKHRKFYVYAIGNTVFSSGYGLPQTYLSTYASQLLHLPAAESSATIAMFNAPGILSCTGFGLLSDKFHVSAGVNTLISALGSALCVFFLWGLKSHTIPGLLIAFSIGYGFFASAYSSTWGGWITDLEKEAASHGEAINAGMLYGFMNGARGVGYVAGGLSGVELLKLGGIPDSRKWAYGTKYGALILFTGVSSVLGGWSVIWKCWSCGKRERR